MCKFSLRNMLAKERVDRRSGWVSTGMRKVANPHWSPVLLGHKGIYTQGAFLPKRYFPTRWTLSWIFMRTYFTRILNWGSNETVLYTLKSFSFHLIFTSTIQLQFTWYCLSSSSFNTETFCVITWNNRFSYILSSCAVCTYTLNGLRTFKPVCYCYTMWLTVLWWVRGKVYLIEEFESIKIALDSLHIRIRNIRNQSECRMWERFVELKIRIVGVYKCGEITYS